MDIWKEIDEFITKHQNDFKMSFALEYSSVIDWVVDFTPGKNHPKARQYGEVIRVQASNRDKALKLGLKKAKEIFESNTRST